MPRLIVLYNTPEDTDAFDAHYRDAHTPIVSRYPNLLEGLAERGWSAGDLAKLTCRNVLRTMRAVEDVAQTA